MNDVVELKKLTDDEVRRFITRGLEEMPFELKDFLDIW